MGTGLGSYSSSNSLAPLGAMGSMPVICMWDCLMPTNRHKNLIAGERHSLETPIFQAYFENHPLNVAAF